MLANFKSLGTTGRFILVGGDSAGGNFSAGLAYKCLQNGLRPPDSLLLIYPSLLCYMYPSPSRLIALFDPLVMFPFLLRCLNCYADVDYRVRPLVGLWILAGKSSLFQIKLLPITYFFEL
jgi:hormone-sensitive lipase